MRAGARAICIGRELRMCDEIGVRTSVCVSMDPCPVVHLAFPYPIITLPDPFFVHPFVIDVLSSPQKLYISLPPLIPSPRTPTLQSAIFNLTYCPFFIYFFSFSFFSFFFFSSPLINVIFFCFSREQLINLLITFSSANDFSTYRRLYVFMFF